MILVLQAFIPVFVGDKLNVLQSIAKLILLARLATEVQFGHAESARWCSSALCSALCTGRLMFGIWVWEGASYLELFILFETLARERLAIEQAAPESVGNYALFLCRLFRLDQTQTCGAAEGS